MSQIKLLIPKTGWFLRIIYKNTTYVLIGGGAQVSARLSTEEIQTHFNILTSEIDLLLYSDVIESFKKYINVTKIE